MFLLAPSRLLDRRHIDLLHLHHRLESPFRFRPAGRHGLRQRPRRDLPRHTPAILAPATRAFLSAVVDDRIPVSIGFFLVVGGDLESERFASGNVQFELDLELDARLRQRSLVCHARCISRGLRNLYGGGIDFGEAG